MRKNISSIGLLFIAVNSFAQTVPSSLENYVFSTICLDAACTKKSETIQYLDGLGRPKQIINVKSSPTQKDVVAHMEYDGFGRQIKDHLPVPESGTQNGSIYANPLSNVSAIYGVEKIYSEKILENSPLNRIQQQIQLGNDWSNKPLKFDYLANIASDNVLKFTTIISWANQDNNDLKLNTSKYFGDNTLHKNVATDEDGNKTIEFKNLDGQTVLIRRELAPNVNTDTYYIYNEFNQLAYVISPEAAVKIDALPAGTSVLSNGTTNSAIQELCYQYRYDGKSRLVENKIPGKGWDYLVYDRADRLILTQDPNMRTSGKWMIIKYDQFGRPIYTGIMQGGTRDSMQNQAGNLIITESKDTTGFTKNGITVYYTYGYFGAPDTVLSVNYYDSYPAGTEFPSTGDFIQGIPILKDTYPAGVNVSTKSLPTASLVKNIEDDKWTKNYIFYDQKGRAIGNYSMNHLGGYTKAESVLDFVGLPQKTFTGHKRLTNSTEVKIEENFTYDNQNRPWKHYHEVIGKSPITLLSENFYDELGRLDHKQVGNSIQDINYKYNIRGWLTSVNNPDNITTMGTDVFGYRIRYNEPIKGLQTPNVNFSNLQVKPKYNGNIAEVEWNSVNATAAQPRTAPYRFGYVYDGLNRLQAGFYQDQANPSRGTYHEIIDQYDLNGNIIKLKRFGGVNKFGQVLQIDDLIYTYNGNKVTNINDSSGNISGYEGGNGLIGYDSNGNMFRMTDKGIANITYNFLNLPKEIEQQNITKYFYRADGVKIKKSFTLNNTTGSNTANTEYLDGFHYVTESAMIAQAFKQTDDTTLSAKTAAEEEIFIAQEEELRPINPGTTMALSFFPTSEGFYDFKKKQYIYQYKDHLGNVRLSYSWDATRSRIEILDRNDYYPFGMNFVAAGAGAVYDAKGSPLNYKFGTKELQETGFYDFGARMLMPDVGRWFTMDPLVEKNRKLTPYHYAANNPIRNIDPDGRTEFSFTGESAVAAFTYLRDNYNSKSSAQKPSDWFWNQKTERVEWRNSSKNYINEGNGAILNNVGKNLAEVMKNYGISLHRSFKEKALSGKISWELHEDKQPTKGGIPIPMGSIDGIASISFTNNLSTAQDSGIAYVDGVNTTLNATYNYNDQALNIDKDTIFYTEISKIFKYGGGESKPVSQIGLDNRLFFNQSFGNNFHPLNYKPINVKTGFNQYINGGVNVKLTLGGTNTTTAAFRYTTYILNQK